MSEEIVKYYDQIEKIQVVRKRIVETVTRLSPEAYVQLLSNLQAKGKAVMTKDPLETAFMLGMQHVLEKLREGFVIGA